MSETILPEFSAMTSSFVPRARGVGLITSTELHRKLLDVVAKHDFDELRALYHDEYVYHNASGAERHGAEAGVEVARTYTEAFPDMSFDIRHINDAGDGRSLAEVVVHGTNTGPLHGVPATGRTISLLMANIIEVRSGLIYREFEYYDSMSLLGQLGLTGKVI
ncbi:ester cyclase [Saccharopolyspora elongata]|uniref:DUF4440 domain-containing protein n=1 Tax=Saccharopolyspora elongata TaxID=2530387 RepID=A0A4V2YIT1_9PSEU|nr:ester cyclase [Saccharopolyspora elongata]TDD36027.1 DUF4440 domain-containing protein [Saccharopolyspora elongata]